MKITHLAYTGLFVLTSFLATAVFADTLSGSGGAGFQTWLSADLNENQNPYWDNPSIDGPNANVGFYLFNAPTAPLSGAPGVLPYWGDGGGTADANFSFLKNSESGAASLKLELAENEDINEFGWYSTTGPLVLHPVILGPNAPPFDTAFNPSAQYGFYIKSSGGTYFTQSSLNPAGDTTHQHFAVFQESAAPGAEAYWLGIEDQNVSELNGREAGSGDYNDMLIHVTFDNIPEPSTLALVLSGALLMPGLLKRRRR